MIWKPRLEQHQQRERLQAVVSSVHEISHEYITGARDFPSSLEKLQQIMELTMDVPAYLSRERWQVGAI